MGRNDQRAHASGNGQVLQVAGDYHAHSPAAQALAGLPAGPGELVGREERAAQLLALLNPAGDGGPVTAVRGFGGIGKTALALHTAHEAVRRGWFAGGALFVALRGYDPAGPVGAEAAVAALLSALGVPEQDRPPTPEEQLTLYRSELARRTEPVLIVADDAATAAQIQPLVPAGGDHRLLVTSRHTLVAPGFAPRLIDLAELTPDAAAALIAGVLRRARPGDERPRRERAALARVGEHCGHLPLALHIVAALLTADPGLRIADAADDLADARARLERLRHTAVDGSSIAVRATFDLSYQRLPAEQQRLFRLITVNPGPQVSTEAAAAIAELDPRETRTLLAALAEACLIAEQPTGSGCWRMHDLIRLYATEQGEAAAEEDRREDAVDRLLDHYLTRTDAADDHLRVLYGQPTPPEFPDRAAAVAWLERERASLVGAVALAAEAGRHSVAIGLAHCLRIFLNRHRHLADALAVCRCAVTAAQTVGDRDQEAGALNILGLSLWATREFDEAIDAFNSTLTIYRELGDRNGEGQALNNLGLALIETGQYEKAIAAFREDLTICREFNDRRGEGQTLNNLGNALRVTGRHEEAIAAFREDLTICREFNDRHGEGQALNNLGLALSVTGRHEEAIAAFREDLTICREFNDRHGEGQTLNNLGNALLHAGQHKESVATLRQALAICRELGERYLEAKALGNLALTLSQMSRTNEALTYAEQAAALLAALGEHEEEADLRHYADLLRAQPPSRWARLRRALTRRRTPAQ
ncbi:tetratricopeptide repeat protein [Streptomyces litchfieldiae]|uniref:Tetratricopeptide repeat protein n=1 Tax=Streptomyces litchfieldiae TaxID=3075543 RepID=A0ABU2MIJ0_9ACTN|nr:tetratricopeptide repeat protein [Streptomyces sp. DSM 44938]MDT0341396.1 tetratricopeptide repeat protein [Streptomyces sp. DSM 44938]